MSTKFRDCSGLLFITLFESEIIFCLFYFTKEKFIDSVISCFFELFSAFTFFVTLRVKEFSSADTKTLTHLRPSLLRLLPHCQYFLVLLQNFERRSDTN